MNETGSSQHISAEAVPLDATPREGRGMPDPVERVARAIAEVAGMSLDSLDMEVVRAAIAAVPGEPVAYRWRWADAPTDAWNASTVNPDQLGKIVEPLYAAPAMPATDAARERIARIKVDSDCDLDTVLYAWWEPEYPSEAEKPLARKMADKTLDAIAALSHPSQGMTDREAIARIIDPFFDYPIKGNETAAWQAWRHGETVRVLEKADAILALVTAAPPEVQP